MRLGPTKSLTFDKYEMCCSLIYQFNSVFTKPHPEELLTPLLLFAMQLSMTNISSKDLCLLVVELSGDTQSPANRDQLLS